MKHFLSLMVFAICLTGTSAHAQIFAKGHMGQHKAPHHKLTERYDLPKVYRGYQFMTYFAFDDALERDPSTTFTQVFDGSHRYGIAVGSKAEADGLTDGIRITVRDHKGELVATNDIDGLLEDRLQFHVNKTGTYSITFDITDESFARGGLAELVHWGKSESSYAHTLSKEYAMPHMAEGYVFLKNFMLDNTHQGNKEAATYSYVYSSDTYYRIAIGSRDSEEGLTDGIKLTIRDAKGSQILTNIDPEGNLRDMVQFKPGATGVYYITFEYTEGSVHHEGLAQMAFYDKRNRRFGE